MKRLGLSWSRERTLSNAEILEAVRLADRKGYEAVFVGEGWGRDAMLMLAHFANHTENIRLGPAVLNVFSRTPTLMAQSAATLDMLSRGRALLGLGTSSSIVVEQWNGMPFRRPLRRLRECVEVVRLALSGERVHYTGEVFELRRFTMDIRPVQERVPIYISADAPKTRALAGEMADGWHLVYVAAEGLPRLLADVEQGLKSAGRGLDECTVTPHILTLASGDEERARRLMRGHLAYYVGGMGPYFARLVSEMGFAEEARAIQQTWQEDRRRAADEVPDALVDAVTIVGDKKRCRERLQQYRDAGADLPVLAFPYGSTLDMICETIEALGEGAGRS